MSELNIDSGTSLQQQNQSGTNGGAHRHGLYNNTNNLITNNNFNYGVGDGGDSILSLKNNRHYPSSRLKAQQQEQNSHHQLLFNSQQNLSTISNDNFSCNSINLNNNGFEKKNSNFTRNRIYGSHQSLSKTKLSSINSNTSSLSRAKIPNQTGSHNNDFNSVDWLNAWNNPPPNIPSAINTKSTTSTAFFSSSTSNIKHNSGQIQINNNRYNDPWTGDIHLVFFLFSFF